MAGMNHVAAYGNVCMKRGKCPRCQIIALIVEGEWTCCGKRIEEAMSRYKVMSQPQPKRQHPSRKQKALLMERFGGACAYCGIKFGEFVLRNHKLVRIKLHWDHVTPYAYSQNNRDNNFVPACHICNGIKSSHVFEDFEQARAYLKYGWHKAGIILPVSTLLKKSETEEEQSKILLDQLSDTSLGQTAPKSVSTDTGIK